MIKNGGKEFEPEKATELIAEELFFNKKQKIECINGINDYFLLYNEEKKQEQKNAVKQRKNSLPSNKKKHEENSFLFFLSLLGGKHKKHR